MNCTVGIGDIDPEDVFPIDWSRAGPTIQRRKDLLKRLREWLSK